MLSCENFDFWLTTKLITSRSKYFSMKTYFCVTHNNLQFFTITKKKKWKKVVCMEKCFSAKMLICNFFIAHNLWVYEIVQDIINFFELTIMKPVRFIIKVAWKVQYSLWIPHRHIFIQIMQKYDWSATVHTHSYTIFFFQHKVLLE